jgi:hypothetical protein
LKGQEPFCSLGGNELFCQVLEVISIAIAQIANSSKYFLGFSLDNIDLFGLRDVPEANECHLFDI